MISSFREKESGGDLYVLAHDNEGNLIKRIYIQIMSKAVFVSGNFFNEI